MASDDLEYKVSITLGCAPCLFLEGKTMKILKFTTVKKKKAAAFEF